MKIIFAGTPAFAAVALESLHQAGFGIPLVLTQPDRPAGRGMQLQSSAVKKYAVEHDLPLIQPASLRLDSKYPDKAAEAEEAHRLLQATEHDVMVVAAYGLILPRSVLEIPPHGCFNIHASLLPRWRGAAPIQRAIEAGDQETGVCIMQMEQWLDTGPVLARRALPIGEQDNCAMLHDKLAALGGDLIVHALFELAQGVLVATPQPVSGATYAEKIGKEEAALDLSADAITVGRKIRAFNPFPGAFAYFNGVPIKFWRASPVAASSDLRPGQVLAADGQNGLVIACGKGCLRLHDLQKPGGKRLPANEFIKGFPLEGGCFD